MYNYHKIAAAITYLSSHFKEQPSLSAIANHVHMSPFHFQKIFSEWAGVSPKKYLQYISLQHAKLMLREDAPSLFDVAFHTGLSGTGRLHDLFVHIEAMTPAEYKNLAKDLQINYHFYESIFGKILVASTTKGVCSIVFTDDEQAAAANLQVQYCNAKINFSQDEFQLQAISFFNKKNLADGTINLHLKGTPFQIKVWEALLKIPEATLLSYGKLAANIESPMAARAVGTAIGSNPVAFIIPCHRVIQATGSIGGYMWGSARKQAIIGWEAANVFGE